ncbi:hypothetical protein SASPL_155269 [Salvia splendens]|uniref:SS18 N-terminal domain-containing protein n=1 Tax=Salvia splendens TaxID=180675 RepID=A0A8X8W1D3_SALSN|nr:hypothetical protein SASPL_155269 [Salvia splendens]
MMQYLDENKKLILAILDNQNLGKLAECAQYQAQLQKNLMYLAAIADAQPQTPAMPSQVTPHPAMQQGGFYMQHPQAAPMSQQQGMFQPRPPPFNNSPHLLQDPQLHPHNQHSQGQLGMRPVGPNNGMNPQHNDPSLGGASSSVPTLNLKDTRGVSMQDKPDSRAAAGPDGQGNSPAVRGSGDAEAAK